MSVAYSDKQPIIKFSVFQEGLDAARYPESIIYSCTVEQSFIIDISLVGEN